MKLRHKANLVCLGLAVGLFQQVLAQNDPFDRPVPKRPYNNENEYVPEELKKPPDLPYLPPYPNSPDYLSIVSYKLSGGPCYGLTFHVKEQSSEVITFYKEALKQYGWQELSSSTSDKMVCGRRRGAIFSVVVMKSIKKNFAAQVYLVYQIYRKT